MDLNEQIWNLAKLRFLQGEARLWIIGHKFLEIAFLIGFLVWGYFEFFSSGEYSYIKYIGLLVGILSFAAMRSRYGSYDGYLNGYESGFSDAATRNLDYWGETHNESTDNMAIGSVLSEIQKNEEKISTENKESRENEVKEGFTKLIGYFLTWRKVR